MPSTFQTYFDNPKTSKKPSKGRQQRSSDKELSLGDDVNRLKQRLEAQGEHEVAVGLVSFQAASKAARLAEKSPEDQSIMLNRELIRRKELKSKHEAALESALGKQKEALEYIATAKALIAKDEVDIADLVAKSAALGVGSNVGGSVLGAAEVLRGLIGQLSQSAKESPEFQALGVHLEQLLLVFQKLIDADRVAAAAQAPPPVVEAPAPAGRDAATQQRIAELKKAFVQGMADAGAPLVSEEEASLDAIVLEAGQPQDRGRSRSREKARDAKQRKAPSPQRAVNQGAVSSQQCP